MSKKIPPFHCDWFLQQKKKKKTSHIFPSINFIKMESFQRYTNKYAQFFQIAYWPKSFPENLELVSFDGHKSRVAAKQ